ncbi:MAG: hypothetical protein ABSG85_02820 [Spirochaetia bacterium]|jgi:hypothetical protein
MSPSHTVGQENCPRREEQGGLFGQGLVGDHFLVPVHDQAVAGQPAVERRDPLLLRLDDLLSP